MVCPNCGPCIAVLLDLSGIHPGANVVRHAGIEQVLGVSPYRASSCRCTLLVCILPISTVPLELRPTAEGSIRDSCQAIALRTASFTPWNLAASGMQSWARTTGHGVSARQATQWKLALDQSSSSAKAWSTLNWVAMRSQNTAGNGIASIPAMRQVRSR